MKTQATKRIKDLKVRKDDAVKGEWFNSVTTDTFKNIGRALQTAGRA